MKRIAIFASGSGSNAERIMEHFANHSLAVVDCVLYNRKAAKVQERAAQFGVDSFYFFKDDFGNGEVLEFLKRREIDYVVLAGFLLLVHPDIIRHFEGRIVNIHPALLPKFGGKGMFGHHVHEAVVEAREKESGPTIHLVNERFDEGAILLQARVQLAGTETADEVAAKVLKLEHQYFPITVEGLIKGVH